MNITDELRELKDDINTDLRPGMVMALRQQLNSIANRIDAEHRAALEKLAAQVDETGDMREFCERIEQAANNREDVTLWGVDYVPLPVDADGVPIRPGDELVIFETGERVRAYDIELYDDGRWLVCDDETMDSIHPDRLRHRAKTVEDVLDEFFGKANLPDGTQTRAEIIAEYAAKLQLRKAVGHE